MTNETEFEKNFSKKMYNSKNIHEITQHIINIGNQWNITSSNNRILNSIQINLAKNKNKDIELDLSKIHILIIHPRYKDTHSNQYHNLDDTIFEYIIDN